MDGDKGRRCHVKALAAIARTGLRQASRSSRTLRLISTCSAGHYRFMSSRERANGPTFGDLGGTSLLDDGGTYSQAWRAARRI